MNGNVSAKSRKIATDGKSFEMMGFVKLTLLSDEMIAKREADMRLQMETERAAKQQKERKEQEESMRIESERLAKLETIRIAEEAKIAAEKKEREEREALIRLHEEELKIRQEQNRIVKEEQRNKLLNAGIESLIEGHDELNDSVKREIEAFFKAKEFKQFEGANREALKILIMKSTVKSNKRWKKFKKGDWNLVIKWVGKDIAQEWFNEMQ